MFIHMVVIVCLTCGCDNGTHHTSPPAATFPVVVFSDVHFNPFYDPSLFQTLVAADVSEWADIFKTSGITAPSAWGSQTNYPLLEITLSSIKQNLGESPMIIFTGDMLAVGFPQTFFSLYGSQDVAAMKTFAEKTVSFFMEQVRLAVGDIPVMFAVGNADSYSGYGPDSGFLSNTAELFYTHFLNGTVDHQAFLTTFASNGYYSAEPSGTDVMVIGLNTILFSPLVPGDHDSAVDTELSWLDSRLASARTDGKKVWILMHIPPGADLGSTASLVDDDGHIPSAAMMWKPDDQTRFLAILSAYSDVITMTLAGHTHMDEYRILSSSEVLEVTPSISPLFGNNPAFKIFTVSSDTGKPMDYQSIIYDLATTPEQFNSYYTFSEAYSVEGPLDHSLVHLFPVLAVDIEKQKTYRGHFFSGHNYTLPMPHTVKPITDTTWPVFWSGIGIMEQQEFIDSVNAY